MLVSIVFLLLFSLFASAEDFGSVVSEWHKYDRQTEITDEGFERSFLRSLALYPANRFKDLLDILTFQVGFGFGLHGNIHATKALQLGAGVSAASKLGIDGRQAGLANDTKSEIAILPFHIERFKRQNAVGNFVEFNSKEDLPYRYQRYRDYWGFGGEVTAGIVNVGGELHVKEVPDFLLGLLGVDYMNDDSPRRLEGNSHPYLDAEHREMIERVAIVPSRIISDPWLRMETGDGINAYYNRYPAEFFWGKLGGGIASSGDRELYEEYTGHIEKQDFDICEELLESMQRMAVVNMDWDIADIDEMHANFKKHSVQKKHKGQEIRRLPNYAGLAQFYGVDAVMDVRIWEWGIWRETLADRGSMKLDVEVKIVDPLRNKVLFDARVNSLQENKKGQSAVEFARYDGKALTRESKEACDIVASKFADLLKEN